LKVACSAIKPNGERCKGLVKAGSDYCPAHDPSRAEARKRAASKAGRARPSKELQDVKDRLSRLAEDVLSGNVDKSTGAVVSQILNVFVRAVSVELKVKEVEELEQRIEQLERRSA